jgi:hypothetical protein
VIISYIPLIILALLISIGLDVILLWRGSWDKWARLAKIAVNLFSISVLLVLIAGHNAWLVEQGASEFLFFFEVLPELAAPNETSLAIIGMHGFRLALIVALIVTAIETVRMVYQLIKNLISPPVTIPLPIDKT